MPTIEDLFVIHTARSKGFESYALGDVAFVTNGFNWNGVLGYISPQPDDRVFDFVGLAVSAFCEVTVQAPPFIARGNGGSGLAVLEPREHLTLDQLGFLAGSMNATTRWRFSWYRQASAQRIRRLEIIEPTRKPGPYDINALVPACTEAPARRFKLGRTEGVPLSAIYDLQAGEYHNASALPPGTTPLISCGDADNGVTGFVEVPSEHLHERRLTIAFNGMNTLTAKYHPYAFAAKDDVAVCIPKHPLRLTSELFIQAMVNRERWRYSYYRKCFIEKLRRFEIAVPIRRGQLNEDVMHAAVEASPLWNFVQQMVRREARAVQSRST